MVWISTHIYNYRGSKPDFVYKKTKIPIFISPPLNRFSSKFISLLQKA